MQHPDCTPELDWQKHPFVMDLPGQNGTVQVCNKKLLVLEVMHLQAVEK